MPGETQAKQRATREFTRMNANGSVDHVLMLLAMLIVGGCATPPAPAPPTTTAPPGVADDSALAARLDPILALTKA